MSKIDVEREQRSNLKVEEKVTYLHRARRCTTRVWNAGVAFLMPSPDDLQRAGKRSGLPYSIRMRLPASPNIYMNPTLGESSRLALSFYSCVGSPLSAALEWLG